MQSIPKAINQSPSFEQYSPISVDSFRAMDSIMQFLALGFESNLGVFSIKLFQILFCGLKGVPLFDIPKEIIKSFFQGSPFFYT
jgi:hypothetical protein